MRDTRVHVFKWGALMFLIGVFGVIIAYADPTTWKKFDETGFILIGVGILSVVGLGVMAKGIKIKFKNAFK